MIVEQTSSSLDCLSLGLSCRRLRGIVRRWRKSFLTRATLPSQETEIRLLPEFLDLLCFFDGIQILEGGQLQHRGWVSSNDERYFIAHPDQKRHETSGQEYYQHVDRLLARLVRNGLVPTPTSTQRRIWALPSSIAKFLDFFARAKDAAARGEVWMARNFLEKAEAELKASDILTFSVQDLFAACIRSSLAFLVESVYERLIHKDFNTAVTELNIAKFLAAEVPDRNYRPMACLKEFLGACFKVCFEDRFQTRKGYISCMLAAFCWTELEQSDKHLFQKQDHQNLDLLFAVLEGPDQATSAKRCLAACTAASSLALFPQSMSCEIINRVDNIAPFLELIVCDSVQLSITHSTDFGGWRKQGWSSRLEDLMHLNSRIFTHSRSPAAWCDLHWNEPPAVLGPIRREKRKPTDASSFNPIESKVSKRVLRHQSQNVPRLSEDRCAQPQSLTRISDSETKPERRQGKGEETCEPRIGNEHGR